MAAICFIREILRKDFPSVSKIILQSDNASGYSSAEHMRTIYQMNQVVSSLPKVVPWINTEAEKGKTILDIHFAFFRKEFQKYVESRHDMHSETTIFEALCFDGVSLIRLLFLQIFQNSTSSYFPAQDSSPKLSGYCTAEVLEGSRKNSSLTNKSIGVFMFLYQK